MDMKSHKLQLSLMMMTQVTTLHQSELLEVGGDTPSRQMGFIFARLCHPLRAHTHTNMHSLAFVLRWHTALLWNRAVSTEWTRSRTCWKLRHHTRTNKQTHTHTKGRGVFLDHDGYCSRGGQGPRYWTICEGVYSLDCVCFLISFLPTIYSINSTL